MHSFYTKYNILIPIQTQKKTIISDDFKTKFQNVNFIITIKINSKV